MKATKRYFVEGAYTELAIAGYTFDLDNGELQTALDFLDEMVAMWAGVALDVTGWLFPAAVGDSSLEDVVYIADTSRGAIRLNLAIRIAASKGKTLPNSTVALAKQGYDFLVLKRNKIPNMRFSSLVPLGTGNRRWVRDQQFYPDTIPLTANSQRIDGIDIDPFPPGWDLVN